MADEVKRIRNTDIKRKNLTFSRKESETMQDNKERKMSENTGSFIKKKKQYQKMGMKILHTCRSEICARFPFFLMHQQPFRRSLETNMFPRSMGNESYCSPGTMELELTVRG